VGWSGALFSKVFCGVVWGREALHGVAKFGPAMYSMVGLGAFWFGIVMFSEALSCSASAKVLFWQGGVEQSEVRRARLLLRHGIARSSTLVSGLARLCAVGQAPVFLGSVLLGKVRWSPVRQGL